MALGSLTPSELAKLKPVLSAIAYNYLATGKYPRIAISGQPFLSAGQRQILEAFAKNPASAGNKLGQFFNSSITAERSVQENTVNNVVKDIVDIRSKSAETSAAGMEQARKVNPNVQPNVPLPPGQIYSYDSTRNLWRVVGSPGGGQPQQTLRYVNQLGETVDEQGNIVQTAPAAGFGSEGGTRAPVTAVPAPTTPATGGIPAGEATYVAAEFGAGVSPYAAAELGQMQAGLEGYIPLPGTTPPDSVTVPAGEPVAETAVETPDTTVMLPQDWEQAAMEQYGGYWSIFQYNPELKQLLIDAVANKWEPQKFQYQLEQTDWWKQTTESARLFDMEEATDPATVQTKIDNQVAYIKAQALTDGIRISDETAAQLARDSLRGGWSTSVLNTAITNEATKSTAGISQLRAGYIGQQINSISNSYGIDLGTAEVNSWVQKWASGQESEESFQASMKEWAKVLYPTISSQIDAGQTFQQVVSPYKSIAAGLLELNPDQINFTEPKWLAAISKTDDKGNQSMMSAAEWQREIRTNRSFGFEFTQQAQNQAYNVADQMAELFGRV